MSKLNQITKLGQKRVLSQQTRQAIKILQLNSLDLNKEIEIDQNPAVGMVLGSVIIGVSIIVAASIH